MIIYVGKVNPNTIRCTYTEPGHEVTSLPFSKERALSQKGILNSTVNFATKKAVLEYDSAI